MKADQLIAHRGSPMEIPENTVASIEAAANAGAVWAEFDIQYTRDFVPILYHDADFQRVSSSNGLVLQTDFEEVRKLPASYPSQFDGKFHSSRINSLAELFQRLPDWPQLKVFPEIKLESLKHFGHQRVVEDLLESISNHSVGGQIAAIISKSEKAIADVRRLGSHGIGWVASDFSAAKMNRVSEIGMDYMFVKQTRLERWMIENPTAAWKWVVYTVNDARDARDWLNRGVEMVETDLIGELIAHGGNFTETGTQ